MSRNIRLVLRNILVVCSLVAVSIGTVYLLAVGFVLFLMSGPNFGINDEEGLAKHFEQNQAALEAVVEEVLAADITYARQALQGRYSMSQIPEDGYESLFEAMRRAEVLRVWVRGDNLSEVTLIVGTRAHMIDTEFFGYLWTPNPENVVEGQGVREGKYLRLSPNWFLYRFEQS